MLWKHINYAHEYCQRNLGGFTQLVCKVIYLFINVFSCMVRCLITFNKKSKDLNGHLSIRDYIPTF